MDELSNQSLSLSRSITSAQEAERQAKADLDHAQNEYQKAQNKLNELQSEIQNVNQNINLAKAQLVKLPTELNDLKEKEVKKGKKVKKLEQRLSGVMYQKLAAEMELHTCDNEFQVEDDSQSVCPESAVDATSKRSMDLVSDFSEMPPVLLF